MQYISIQNEFDYDPYHRVLLQQSELSLLEVGWYSPEKVDGLVKGHTLEF